MACAAGFSGWFRCGCFLAFLCSRRCFCCIRRFAIFCLHWAKWALRLFREAEHYPEEELDELSPNLPNLHRERGIIEPELPESGAELGRRFGFSNNGPLHKNRHEALPKPCRSGAKITRLAMVETIKRIKSSKQKTNSFLKKTTNRQNNTQKGQPEEQVPEGLEHNG